MSLRLKDIQYVEEQTVKLISGYLRNISKQQVKDNCIIVDLILYICALFYFEKEYFVLIINGGHRYDEPMECFQVSDNKRTVVLNNRCCWSEVICVTLVILRQIIHHRFTDCGACICTDIILSDFIGILMLVYYFLFLSGRFNDI